MCAPPQPIQAHSDAGTIMLIINGLLDRGTSVVTWLLLSPRFHDSSPVQIGDLKDHFSVFSLGCPMTFFFFFKKKKTSELRTCVT